MDRLYQLIQSLSPAEKRYFMKAAVKGGKHGEKPVFRRLFDVMDAADSYDEQAFRKAFGAFAPDDQYAVTKNYLHRGILRALRAFHLGKSVRAELREMIDFIEILFFRELFEDCGRWIRKAIKKARKYDETLILLELMRWQLRWQRRQATPDPGEITDLSTQLRIQLEAVRQEYELGLLNDHIFSQLSARGTDASERKALADLLEAELPETDEALLSIQSRVIALNLRANFARLEGDLERLFEHQTALVDLLERVPRAGWQEDDRFVRMLLVYADTCIHTGRFDRYDEVMARLRAFEPRAADARARKAFLQAHLELSVRLNRCHVDDRDAVAAEVTACLAEYGEKIGEAGRLTLYHNMALLYWMADAPAAAMRWVNRTLSEPGAEVRRGIRRFARLLELILTYEKGDFDLLSYRLRSARRVFRRKVKADRQPVLLLDALEEILKDPAVVRPEFWATLGAQLKDVQGAGGEALVAWVRARAEGRRLIEVLQAAD